MNTVYKITVVHYTTYMGVEERKKRDRERMRNRILSAAMKVFSEGGYQHVSMRRIASKIEYSPGTLYRYFRNKEDIMRQLCFQGFERLLAIQEKLAHIHDPLERLVTGSRYYLSFALENPELYELMFGIEEIIKQPDQAEETVALRSFRKHVETVQDCVDAGVFGGHDVGSLAVAIWAALHGLSSLLIKKQLRFLPPAEVDMMVENALHFILRSDRGLSSAEKEPHEKRS
jgi:AcrR family transcriptional regulator